MQFTHRKKQTFCLGSLTMLLLVQPEPASAQSGGNETIESAPKLVQKSDISEVAGLIQQLQSQMKELNFKVGELKRQQEAAQAESAALREELDAAKSQIATPSAQSGDMVHDQIVPAAEDRINKLEEYQQLTDAKAAEQSQTKVESASKYRVRLSGLALFNTYVNRGTVENQDFPQLATAPGILSSDGSFGASLRQSQIGIQGFGPTIAGARTSAEVHLDFAGGFPDAPNGVSFGIMRLRTGTIRFDWEKTSIIAGQDSLFIAPLSPTSIAALATPALAYSGNLWSWTPQIRMEHSFTISERSSLLVQAGILDSLSGERPASGYYRSPTLGESSGQPAYATRLALNQVIYGQNVTFGVGGYYGRQNWGHTRSINTWAGTMDLTLPLGKMFEFSSQVYRGRATGGLNGGIGQSVLWIGSLADPATEVYGLHSIGGWAQLKYKATTKLQFNGAFGQDNPSAGDRRQFGGSQPYYTSPLSKNHSSLVNFLYEPRSNVVVSLEYRRLKTFTLDSNANAANIVNFSLGYLF